MAVRRGERGGNGKEGSNTCVFGITRGGGGGTKKKLRTSMPNHKATASFFWHKGYLDSNIFFSTGNLLAFWL